MDDNRTDGGLFKVSQSKVKQYRECRRKWWYAHVLKIQRKRIARPLKFGSIIHKMKETLAVGKNPYTVLDEIPREDLEAFRDDPEEYGDIITDIEYIFKAYQAFYKNNQLKYLKLEKKQAEFPFQLDIPKQELQIKGTIDAVTEYRKFIWLTEHKNHKNIPNDDERWRSVQSAVYIKIIQLAGWWKNIEGTCWDYIRSKPPTRPDILKNGSVSVRKIDTLPQVVKDSLKGHEKDPNYKVLIDAATLNMSTYFQRIYTPVKKDLVELLWKDFLSTAREMRDAPLKEPVMTIGRHCSWCQFEPICRTILSSGDVDFIIEHNYVPSTYGENHEETSEV